MSEQHPHVRTIAIAAFGGWNDAGSASSEVITHLMNTWGTGGEEQARHVIDANAYIDFHINRPLLTRGDNGQRKLIWPHTVITPVMASSQLRVLLIEGPEPSFNWSGFSEEILDYLSHQGANTLVTMGALLAEVPHTRPLPISVSRHEAGELNRDGAPNEGGYEGPVGIPTVLANTAQERGFTTISMWVQVPNYVGPNPAPKAALALLHALEDALEVRIDLGDFPEDTEAWERGMNALADQEEDIAAYVKQLEGLRDTAELPEASGDAIAHEFERFLRRRENTDTEG